MSKRRPRPKLTSPRLWGAWIAVGAAWLAARLPLRWLIGLGRLIGTAAFHLAPYRRRITETNLRLCFPELSEVERRRLARQVFAHTGVSLAEMLLVWLNPRRRLEERFTLTGLEHLEQARALGRGVILLAGHFSCIDIASGPVSRVTEVDVMYRENKNPVWEWLQVRGRRHYFNGVIERNDVREVLRRLKAGRTVWYAADQDYGRKHSVFAPFFGMPAATITATARLARFNRSPVVFLTQYRNLRLLTWEARFHPALADFPGDDEVADAARINGIIEEAIRTHPEQYLWAHRRFKTRPAGEPRPY